uniref:Uncharacterized protein n=1 Tax=Ralstonia solanacearum TaxID=305 RepID=A0A0S4U467_RALSL|nr:protein of unknown function [Ralstonia solanacearum]
MVLSLKRPEMAAIIQTILIFQPYQNGLLRGENELSHSFVSARVFMMLLLKVGMRQSGFAE